MFELLHTVFGCNVILLKQLWGMCWNYSLTSSTFWVRISWWPIITQQNVSRFVGGYKNLSNIYIVLPQVCGRPQRDPLDSLLRVQGSGRTEWESPPTPTPKVSWSRWWVWDVLAFPRAVQADQKHVVLEDDSEGPVEAISLPGELLHLPVQLQKLCREVLDFSFLFWFHCADWNEQEKHQTQLLFPLLLTAGSFRNGWLTVVAQNNDGGHQNDTDGSQRCCQQTEQRMKAHFCFPF